MNIQPTDINVLDLLPQRPPFIMVDKLTHFEPKSAKTVFTVRADNMFCIDGVMEESGFVENIAQTCAVYTGFKQHLGNNSFGIVVDDTVPEQTNRFGISKVVDEPTDCKRDEIKIGVIAMINTLDITRRPVVGEVLETSISIEDEVFSTTVVSAEVKIAGDTVATCRMKLFLTDKTPKG